MKASTIIVVAIVLYGIIGDLYFREFFHTLGIILAVLFTVFLIVYYWMDHKEMFSPRKKH